jgi:hypothetical protein
MKTTFCLYLFVFVALFAMVPSAYAAGCGFAEHYSFTCPDCGEQERGTCFVVPVEYYCYQGYGNCCGQVFTTSNQVVDEEDCPSVHRGVTSRHPLFSNDANLNARLRIPNCRGGFVDPGKAMLIAKAP